MEGRTDTGVKGFFNDFGKAVPVKAKPLQVEPTKPSVATPTPPAVPPKRPASKKTEIVRARVGRPPGAASGTRPQKGRATMYINQALLDYYRDWSWDARCSLGELIERAMVAYKATGNRASIKKTTRT
jgi:hypothetical protein